MGVAKESHKDDEESKCTLGLRLDDEPNQGGALPNSTDTVVSGLTNPLAFSSGNAGRNDLLPTAASSYPSPKEPSSNLKSEGDERKLGSESNSREEDLTEEKKEGTYAALSSEAAGNSATAYPSKKPPENTER